MSLAVNLRGKTLGDLRIIQQVASIKGHRRWRCECSCGRRVTVRHNRLIHKTNPKTHCGCKRGGLPKRFKVEYHAWWDARERCHNPKHPSYATYGAKGTWMHKSWRDSFQEFLDFIGTRPSDKHSLDRIDAKGHYEPGNVRWATDKTQARNKRNTKWVKHPVKGTPIRAAELAEELGVTYQEMRKEMVESGKW